LGLDKDTFSSAGGRGPKQADILIGLAQSAELFHSLDGTGSADLDINGRRETWPIRFEFTLMPAGCAADPRLTVVVLATRGAQEDQSGARCRGRI